MNGTNMTTTIPASAAAGRPHPGTPAHLTRRHTPACALSESIREGAELEDARTEQLEWHPVRQLVSATRAVTPRSIA